MLIHQFGNIIKRKFCLLEFNANLMGIALINSPYFKFLFYYGFGLFTGYSSISKNKKIKMTIGGLFDFYNTNESNDFAFYNSNKNIILKYVSYKTFLILFGIEYRIQFNFEK